MLRIRCRRTTTRPIVSGSFVPEYVEVVPIALMKESARAPKALGSALDVSTCGQRFSPAGDSNPALGLAAMSLCRSTNGFSPTATQPPAFHGEDEIEFPLFVSTRWSGFSPVGSFMRSAWIDRLRLLIQRQPLVSTRVGGGLRR